MKDVIRVRGAREHNLKNVDVDMPRNRLVVVTGPSGSGKSSLVFDTLYAEGQRRYLQSLSIYARQFIGNLNKPAVDDISGLPPTISVEQRGSARNPRSTVGTATEVYDYLRVLYSSIGVAHCLKCGKPLVRLSIDEIMDEALKIFDGKPVEILAPVVRGRNPGFAGYFAELAGQGYVRVRVDGETLMLDDADADAHDVDVVIDRLRFSREKISQITESVEAALRVSEGSVVFASRDMADLELTDRSFCPDCREAAPALEPRLFSFNSPVGACPVCSGLGVTMQFIRDCVIDWSLPLAEGGFPFWKNNKHTIPKAQVLAELHGWDLSLPLRDLPEEAKRALIDGTDEPIPWVYRDGSIDRKRKGEYEGLMPWLDRKMLETESDSLREELSNCQSEIVCPACGGKRLRPEALAVTVGGHSTADLADLPIRGLEGALRNLKLDATQRHIARNLLQETIDRVAFLRDIGVDYIALSRRADTLSGGETQRIRLATQIGARLFGVLYLLDEPTVGLHPRDTDRLLRTLRVIRDDGNSIVVVEHDRDTMCAADWIVELGPGAGELGGEIVASGAREAVEAGDTATAKYLRGEADGSFRPLLERRTPQSWIVARGCREHNLQNIDVSIPTGVLCALSGVSGSGKSTFLYDILYKGLRRELDRQFKETPGDFDGLALKAPLRSIILVDQAPIGRTPRSNPATYIGLFDAIRNFYALLPESKIRGYGPARFSFNVKGGRCEACRGEGVVKVPMLFLPEVHVPCDVCGGRRYNRETLEVRYRGLSIADVLDLTVDEAARTFGDLPKIARKVGILQEAGLGYIRLGQPADSLSGGEAQRVKLAAELGKQTRGHTLYLMDEPTSGLSYTDVKNLLKLIHKLVGQGNSVLAIEHNLDVLASSDWIVDLGPGGGEEGGRLVAAGPPEAVADSDGPTGKYLKKYLSAAKNRKS